MKPYPIYVSYATKGRYAALLANLRESAQRFDLILRDLVTDMRFETWQAAAAHKRRVIRAFMTEYPSNPIVWVDADAVFKSYPSKFDELADTRTDFAACWRLGHELLSGTLYWGCTSGSARLMDEWDRFQAMDPGNWDQRTLASAVLSCRKKGLKDEVLPAGYAFIFDRTGRENPGVDPVIEHYQASRGK